MRFPDSLPAELLKICRLDLHETLGVVMLAAPEHHAISNDVSEPKHSGTHVVFGCLQMYGMSEAGMVSLNDPARPGRCRFGTAGLPMPGYEVSIMDPKGGHFNKAGQVGEICVRGELVFRGYHNQPELNAASFVGEHH